jgi:hypothetical protein
VDTTIGHGPQRRRIGRILSLGFPLPGPRVDNYGFLSAPSYFEYDAVVLDPRMIGETVERVLAGDDVRTFTGAPVRVEPSRPGDAVLSGEIERRRDELSRMLDRDGVVVLVGRVPARHDAAAGATAFDDLGLLDTPPSLARSEGTAIDIVDDHHPLASFLHHQSANILFEAALEPASAAEGHTVATSLGGAVIAAELPRRAGRIVLLPALKSVPSGQPRYSMSEALQRAIRDLLGVMAEGHAPAWVAKHALPGLDQSAADLALARTERDASQRALEAAEAAHDDLARYRRLLWQQGAKGLDDVVVAALRRLEFDVYDRDQAALEARFGGVSVLLEVEASDDAVDMAAHRRLRQRLERRIEGRGTPARGLLFVNAHRLLPIAERPKPVTDAALAAAEALGYRIATTASLYEAMVALLEGDQTAVERYREALLNGSGLLAGAATAVDGA